MSGPRATSRAAAVIAALLATSQAAAQAPAAPSAPPTPDPVDLVNRTIAEEGVFRFDFGVPSSPSLNLLGQPEDKVTVVNGLKPFIIQLPRILAEDSDDGQSLGIDVSPAWLFTDPSQRTTNSYIEATSLDRILTRTHIGGALYEGVQDTDPTKARASRVTIGLSTSLLNDSDPLLAHIPGESQSAWRMCLTRHEPRIRTDWLERQSRPSPEAAALDTAMAQLIARRVELDGKISNGTATSTERTEREGIPARLLQMQADRAAFTQAAMAAAQGEFARTKSASVFTDCAREANLVARYSASLGVGLGALWNGDPGRLRNFSQAGWVAWASFRYPIGAPVTRGDDGTPKAGSRMMIGFSGRAGIDEIIATNDATMPLVQANVFDGWAGIEMLNSASRFSIQVGYQIRDTEGRLASFDRERLRYFASYSQRLGGENSSLWLRVGYGHVRSSDDDDTAFAVSILFAPPSAANLFGTN